VTDYQPIACELHSQHELVIMQAHFVLVAWKNDVGEIPYCHEIPGLKPVDIFVSNK
jgi:hypothetical protein